MKDLEYYTKKNYRIEIIRDEGGEGYVAQYPELKGCITCAGSIEKAVANLEDAKREWLAAALEDGYSIPEPDSDERYSGQFKLRIPKALHRALAEESKREGISMNQYCVYLLSRNLPETPSVRPPSVTSAHYLEQQA